MLTVATFPSAAPRRPQTYAVLKSLVNVDSAQASSGGLPGQDQSAGQLVINFPCMPDTLELARRANYRNNVESPVSPDGFHTYHHTDPLKIPITFSLHGYDKDYCKDSGPLMLLAIAAKLHALVMPVHAGGNLAPTAKAAAEAAFKSQGSLVLSEAEYRQKTSTLDQETASQVNNASNIRFAFPPACSLNIMMAQIGGSYGSVNQSTNGIQSLGINCHGFIEDVRAVLFGPWLQGSFNQDGMRNLPSRAEFSFTFVHQPGYTNFLVNNGFKPSLLTTNAWDVATRLYNTVDLAGQTGLEGTVRYANLAEFNSPTPLLDRIPSGVPKFGG